MDKLIVVALEGTLSDDSHRYALRDFSFEDYHEAITGDSVNEKLLTFLDIFCNSLDEESHPQLIVYSSTPENLRPAVIGLLNDNNVYADKILLKRQQDYRPEYEVKISMLEGLDGDIIAVIESSNKIAEALREKGILVLSP